MPRPVNYANVNLTLQQFNEIAIGKYNAGEVRLAGENALEKINNHVHRTGQNRVSLSHAEVLAIKDAFVRALSHNGVGQDELNRIRQELGLAPRDAIDLRLAQRSIKPLSRQQIRDILDRNVDAINNAQDAFVVRTDDELHAGYGATRRNELKQKRIETNRALAGQRATDPDVNIGLVQSVISGNVDFHTDQTRQALLEAAKRQKAVILERSHGNPSQAPNASLHYRRESNGLDVEFNLGMSEAEYVDKLDDMILRLSATRRPSDAVLAARREFDALKNFDERVAWIDAQANAPDGAFKVRTAAVLVLHARGVDDYATLSLVNRLSDADARVLLAILLQLPKERRGAALRDDPAVAAFAQRAGTEAPEAARTFIPALSDLEFNRAVRKSISTDSPDLPHRFKAVLLAAKADVEARFGAGVLPANFKLSSLSKNWSLLLGLGEHGDAEDAPAITPDVLRQRLAADAAAVGAKRFFDARVAAMLAEAGGNAGDAVGVASHYLQGHPEFYAHLAAAQNLEAAQAVVDESAADIRAAIHLHIVCENEKNAFVAQCREMLAREMGASPASLYDGEAMFATAERKAVELASQFISGERVAGNDDAVRAAFRQLAEENVAVLAAALRKVETLDISQIAKNEVVDQLMNTAIVRDIDLDAVAEYAKQVNLSVVTASIGVHAPKDEVYAILKSFLEKTEAMTGLILARRGVQEFGAPEIYTVRSLLLSMAGAGEPDFVARIREFAARADVRDDDLEDMEKPSGALGTFLAYVAPPEEEKTVPVPFRVRASAGRDFAALFAPEGEATRRALEIGYYRPELDMLRRTAELYQAATGCSAAEAVTAALDHASAARRLFSYGGRFTASPQNFRDGLKLMADFTAWFASANAQIDPKRPYNGHLPAGAGVTAINADKAFFKPNTSFAFERFLFEEIAVNPAIPLKAADPERIFGMEANPATRTIGRGYTKSSALTLAQIPPERRSVLYAVIDVLSPLGVTEAEARANALDLITCEIISRVMRRYDDVAAMKAAGQLTRANILAQIFPDVENGANLSNEQLKDYFTDKILNDVVPNRLNGDFTLVPQIASMTQWSGATIDEAVDAATAGEIMPLAPYIASSSADLHELDGTATAGRKMMFADLHRPETPTLVPGGQSAITNENAVFKVMFPDGTVLKSVSGAETNAEVVAASGAISTKVAELCGSVHPQQLGAVYFALSQSGAGPVNRGLVQYGINSSEHMPLTYTLSKNAETGAVTIRYSEPEGLPIHFHWETTIAPDGTTTTTALAIDG